jgi:hypothetical protein
MRGDVTRRFFGGTGAGGMLLSWLIGLLFKRAGLRSGKLVILLDLIIALVVFGVVLEMTRRNFENI